jgi:hypothetical protein
MGPANENFLRPMISISVKSDVAAMRRGLDSVARGQLPFALAMALNEVGRAAVVAEREALRAAMPTSTRFTLRGVRLWTARKATPMVVVYISPIQARYLALKIEGGVQVTRGRATLLPVDQATNQYGNLPRNLLSRLRGRPDIFIGGVETKSGIVNGVWQTMPARRRTRRVIAGVAVPAGPLKLLVRFADPVAAHTRYPFGRATMTVARTQFGPAFALRCGRRR